MHITSVLLAGLLFSTAASGAETHNLIDIYYQALANDPTWAAAQSANQAVQERLAQARALFFPTINFNTNVSYTDGDVEYTSGDRSPFSPGRNRFETFGYEATLNQPVFRRQNNVQYAQAALEVTQSDLQLLLTQQELMLRTAQAYFDVLLAQDKIELINAQKLATSEQREQAEANFEYGEATITDVNEAQARYDLILAQEIAALNEFEVKRRAVQAITGAVPQKLAAVNPDISITLPQPADMETWVDLAEQNNLNLNIQQRALEIAAQEVDKQTAGHYPTLDIVGSHGNTQAKGSLQGFGTDTVITQIGLQLQIPIYQGGLVTAQVREAMANKQRAMDEVEIARRQAELDTREAFLNLSGSVSQVRAYEQALASSQSQVRSTSLGYENGVRNSVDVLNAQQQYFSAQRDLLEARYTYLISILKLQSATGLINEADLRDVNQRLVKNTGQADGGGDVIVTPLPQ